MTLKKVVGFAALFLALAVLAWLGWCGVRTVRQAESALTDLNHIEALAQTPSPASLPALRENFAALEGHLKATEAAARPFLWLASRVGWLPKVGPTVHALPPFLEMAIELSSTGRQTLDALDPVLKPLIQPGQGDLLSKAVPALASAAPELAAAEARLAEAQRTRATITGSLHPRLARQLERIDGILPLAQMALQAAQAVPEFLGADRPRTYLILAQNNHELRGTGGFISAVGFVRVENGRIIDLKLTDSYAADNLRQPHPLPPPALSEQMGAQILLLRDSNWSPDFPSSAQVARALYQQDQGVATDGAIAVDLEATRLLVGALGSLTVEGIPGPITADNILAKMRQAREAPPTSQDTIQDSAIGDWWSKRKDFMGLLMTAALARMQGGVDLNPIALAQALLKMLDGRHLQVAVDDTKPATLLAARGWDGSLQPPAAGGDFLAVVDSNVGFNKANAAVGQELAYRVITAPDGVEATLTMTYTHSAPPLPPNLPCDRTPRLGRNYDELIQLCYWDYLRVYVPNGSKLLNADGLRQASAQGGEQGTTLFAGDFVLRPGEKHVVTLTYRLPLAMETSPYRLLVRKQAGTPAEPLRVAIGSCGWETTLDSDRKFTCETWPQGVPP